MILIAQDCFKAFNMAYIKSYFIYEDKFGKLPTLPATDEKHEYIICVDSNPTYGDIANLYTIGKFEKLEDAQNVFAKLTSIINPAAEGVISITEKDVSFFGKDAPIWRCKPNA